MNESVIFSPSRVYLPSALKRLDIPGSLNIPQRNIRMLPDRVQDIPSGVKIFPAQSEKASPTELGESSPVDSGSLSPAEYKNKSPQPSSKDHSQQNSKDYPHKSLKGYSQRSRNRRSSPAEFFPFTNRNSIPNRIQYHQQR